MSAKTAGQASVPLDGCVIRAVSDVFETEPQLEAVTLDRAGQSIDVATLGKKSEPAIIDEIARREAA